MKTHCIVLAGGLGTRLRSVMQLVPKCLAPIAGQPFLRWQLESLAQRGIEHFVLSLGIGSDQVLEAIKEPWAKKLKIECIIESEPLGTGGATHFVMTKSNLNEALVVNGDTFLGGSLDVMLLPLDIRNGELMRIATVTVEDRSRFGGVEVDQENYVKNFLEKGRVNTGQINAGLYRVSTNAFSDRPAGQFSLEAAVMPRLVFDNNLRAFELEGPFIDIGVPEDYYLFSNSYQNFTNTK